jgi:ABC-type transport system involved in multi-copper enzyme maturation permease subunit
MWNYLKYLVLLEYKKFRYNNVVLAILAIYILIAPAIILAGKDVVTEVPPPLPSSAVFYEFPTVWDYQGYTGSWMVSFCLGFMMIYIITSEVSHRTLRQNIITGMSRKDWFLSKLITLFLLAGFASALYFFSSLIIGVIHTDGWDIELALDNNMATARFFLMSVGYLSFAFLLAFMIRRGTLALLTYFLWVMMLESIFKIIHIYFFRNKTANYWPMNTVEDLMPFPIFKLPDYYINKEWGFRILLSYTEAATGTLIYSILFLGLAWWSFRTRDI